MSGAPQLVSWSQRCRQHKVTQIKRQSACHVTWYRLVVAAVSVTYCVGVRCQLWCRSSATRLAAGRRSQSSRAAASAPACRTASLSLPACIQTLLTLSTTQDTKPQAMPVCQSGAVAPQHSIGRHWQCDVMIHHVINQRVARIKL